MKSHHRSFWRFIVLVILTTIAVVSLQTPQWARSPRISNYAVLSQFPYNQPQTYPIETQPPTNYRAIANWVGRLILPQPLEMPSQSGKISDWVWIEILHAPAPHRDLIGETVRLEWRLTPDTAAYVRAVTRDVTFTAATLASIQARNVHPDRLNGRQQVGPLQSLAGARPNNDVVVALEKVAIASPGEGKAVLQIDTDPVLATGPYYGLVQILPPDPQADNRPPTCPGGSPCPSELVPVRHYNSATGKFDGAAEMVRIPQQPLMPDNLFQSTPRDLSRSVAGQAGWYIYGARDKAGMFVVRALLPRALLQLQPQLTRSGESAGLEYINSENWGGTPAQKGTTWTAVLNPAAHSWQEGDRALVIHSFGGIGGKKAEPAIPATVTGHFAYGIARVIREPITGELQFELHYQQVYAQNPNGIISGTHTWADYLGNMQWGWLGLRPVADAIVDFQPLTRRYQFGDLSLSPLDVLEQQLRLMTARYRIGDGTGAAIVTPATSCVQDANQALYLTIQALTSQVQATPAIQTWLTAHPQDPQTLDFQKLTSLEAVLKQRLTPLGMVRSDWQQNSRILAGIDSSSVAANQGSIDAFSNNSRILYGLTSWRTMIPRRAQDELTQVFFQQGAPIWFLRTNQVGGWDPDVLPLAPTLLFGQVLLPWTQIPILSILLSRIMGALQPVTLQGWGLILVMLVIYSAIALPWGFRAGFLRLQLWRSTLPGYLGLGGKLWLFPALGEELLMRVLLLPHPTEAVTGWMGLIWGAIGIGIFVVYHPLNALTFYPNGKPTFFDPVFLTLAAGLGVICTVTYAFTGSLWGITLIHWLVVAIWLIGLGGMARLHRDSSVGIALPKKD